MASSTNRCSFDACEREARYGDRCLTHLRPLRKNWIVYVPATEVTFAEAFWMSVRTGEPDACWPWLGASSANGYGHFNAAGQYFGAHRVALELATGPIPDGHYATHACDNPICCNPNHLRAGTHRENDAQRNSRMRHAYGERNASAKLTNRDVQAIRAAVRRGTVQKDLAGHFGVSLAVISRIVRGEGWTHVPNDPSVDLAGLPAPRPRAIRRGVANNKAKLNPQLVTEIRSRYAQGESQTALAKAFNVHQTTISPIVRGESWKES